MLGKLLYGRFSLKETFWKFGVLSIFLSSFVMRIIKAFLLQHLNGLSISQYYTHYFSLLNMNGTMLFFTLMYFLGMFVFACYLLIVWLGVWRSSAEYNKSVWLGWLARIVMLLVIYAGLKICL